MSKQLRAGRGDAQGTLLAPMPLQSCPGEMFSQEGLHLEHSHFIRHQRIHTGSLSMSSPTLRDMRAPTSEGRLL